MTGPHLPAPLYCVLTPQQLLLLFHNLAPRLIYAGESFKDMLLCRELSDQAPGLHKNLCPGVLCWIKVDGPVCFVWPFVVLLLATFTILSHLQIGWLLHVMHLIVL
jgi:hypothetical protein